MFLRDDHEWQWAGGTAGRSAALAAPARPIGRRERWRRAAAAIDWVPDLGARVGGRAWWRGVATLSALCGAAWALSPGFRPVTGDVPAPLAGAAHEEARAGAIAPLAWGSDTGRRMASNELAVALAEAPERPSVEMTATLGEGDGVRRLLERAGVGRDEAEAATALIGGATAIDDIPAGTTIALTLGRRPSKLVPRPLERLAVRARFDLALLLTRAAGGLTLTRTAIAVDTTPWRLQGLVGHSLYRSLRAAGAPARVADAYLRAVATRRSIGRDVAAADQFDLVIERAHAATGETHLGGLLFAGLDGARGRTQLVRWGGDDDNHHDWWDADGTIEHRGELGTPVAGHVTSGFGMRFHPVLGFTRMHKGIDIGAPRGTPVYAVADGRVASAGWSGGYGNFIRLAHSPSLATGYGHLARIAVRAGQTVRRGAVIGYVGSTGLSTGPHLHWEVWKGGVAVNPTRVSLDRVERLGGDELRRFRATLAGLLAVKPGS